MPKNDSMSTDALFFRSLSPMSMPMNRRPERPLVNLNEIDRTAFSPRPICTHHMYQYEERQRPNCVPVSAMDVALAREEIAQANESEATTVRCVFIGNANAMFVWIKLLELTQ